MRLAPQLGQDPRCLQLNATKAITVTVSVQLVSVYLIFASLILPAIATRKRMDLAALAIRAVDQGLLVGKE